MTYVCPKCRTPPSAAALRTSTLEFIRTLDCPRCGYSPGREAERQRDEERKRDLAAFHAGRRAEEEKRQADEAHRIALEQAKRLAEDVRPFASYKVIEEDSKWELEREVNSAIADGWVPIGAVSTVRKLFDYQDGAEWKTVFSQAMGKR